MKRASALRKMLKDARENLWLSAKHPIETNMASQSDTERLRDDGRPAIVGMGGLGIIRFSRCQCPIGFSLRR